MEGGLRKSNDRISLRRPVGNSEHSARGVNDDQAVREQTDHPPSQTSEFKVRHLGRQRMTRRRLTDKKEEPFGFGGIGLAGFHVLFLKAEGTTIAKNPPLKPADATEGLDSRSGCESRHNPIFVPESFA
jgi:hypothetical protein